MAKNPHQKLKLLYLHQILLQKTDENHKLNMDDILRALACCGIEAERKSIYSDIAALQDFGLTSFCSVAPEVVTMLPLEILNCRNSSCWLMLSSARDLLRKKNPMN